MTLLTFIIPVRHQDNARDWTQLCAKLTQTMASIANQSLMDWQGIVVANEGADLPSLPAGFRAVRVDFPPNDMHELGRQGHDAFYEAFRADKGRRVLKGMLAARDSRYFMIVDDDDFVSSRITSFIAKNDGANGWFIEKGYVWSDGGSLLLGHDRFNKLCGTSLIIRSDLYELPAAFEDASLDWIKQSLGSHIFITDALRGRGSPLAALPFRGAVYRVGHAGSHSQAGGILSSYFLNRKALRHPRSLLSNLVKLRPLNRAVRAEFFGV